jgi:predicted DNA-binding transcriptional regulator YafY
MRRDLDALTAAGVPVYPQRGRGGGWALIGGHRIDLSGLTRDEAVSLVLASLGVPDQADLGAALRKVIAALPSVFRDEVAAAQAQVHVDTTPWRRRLPIEPARDGERALEPFLLRLRQSLKQGVQVDLGYGRQGQIPTIRRVHPLGLIIKERTWYLLGVSASELRTYRVSRVVSVELTTESANRPPGFDLDSTWSELQREFLNLKPSTEVEVELLVDPQVWNRFSTQLGSWWELVDLGVDAVGRRKVRVQLPKPSVAAVELLGFGDSIEVLSPPVVREHLAELGERLVARYSKSKLELP